MNGIEYPQEQSRKWDNRKMEVRGSEWALEDEQGRNSEPRIRSSQFRHGKNFIIRNCCKLRRPIGVVIIATCLRAGQTRSCVSIPGTGNEIFLSLQRPYGFWGPLSLLRVGYRRKLAPVIKRALREADPYHHVESKKRRYGAITPLLQ